MNGYSTISFYSSYLSQVDASSRTMWLYPCRAVLAAKSLKHRTIHDFAFDFLLPLLSTGAANAAFPFIFADIVGITLTISFAAFPLQVAIFTNETVLLTLLTTHKCKINMMNNCGNVVWHWNSEIQWLRSIRRSCCHTPHVQFTVCLHWTHLYIRRPKRTTKSVIILIIIIIIFHCDVRLGPDKNCSQLNCGASEHHCLSLSYFMLHALYYAGLWFHEESTFSCQLARNKFHLLMKCTEQVRSYELGMKQPKQTTAIKRREKKQ